MNSIIHYLEHWALNQPGKRLSCFLDEHGQEIESYTYLTFHERTGYVAEYLSRQGDLKRGDRVLLIYPPGLELIVAFIACVRIGVIPVPVYPPTPVNFERGLTHVTYVAQDCDARTALTTRGLYQSYLKSSKERQNSTICQCLSVLQNLRWVTTDQVRGKASNGFYNDPGTILFLQYTSGSTHDPKGVIVSHKNVIHNCHATIDHIPTGVSWLPQYHDMGLIGYYLYPMITGGTTYGFSPTDFLKYPLLWLKTLSQVRATYTSSPNFGFEYCLRKDKISTEELNDLDLSSVRVMMNASEPVCADTYRRFLARFGKYGLGQCAHVVAYGLAENTLAVTHYGRRLVTVNKQLLHQGTIRIESSKLPNNNQLTLVSCGKPLDGIHLRIVDPKSHAALGNKEIGEIWVAGESKCLGYWNRSELTHEVFNNTVSNDPNDNNEYLRTGDLGYVENGELFICGRLKDLIILRGINYYPQDIERIVESTLNNKRIGSVVAFTGNEQEEKLVVLVEIRTADKLPDPTEISHALRTQYYVGPHTIAFVPVRTIAKTTSGKIARRFTRQRWLNGELKMISIYTSGEGNEITRNLSSGIIERFQFILDQYNLTGFEEYTLAEIGLDSLTLVMLLLDIEQILEENGASDLVNDIDGRLLQSLSVADFFSIIEQLENSSNESSSARRLVLLQIKKENDKDEQDRMRRDAELSTINCINLLENEQPLDRVLLTGPTGFFGPFLLSSLLSQTPYTYFALTRASDPHSGKSRIRDALRDARLLTPALNEKLEERVHVVCGDISQSNLGMSLEQWQSLSTSVQAVIHNAALVNYVLNYDSLKPHNVDGTRELLRFSFNGILKEFHFISSTVIFGWIVKGELKETDNNEYMSNLDFGYAQSKWVAEQLVFAAKKQGLNVTIYRPAFISAATNGIANQDDIIIRLLSFMINHGIGVNALNQISFLPADITANNISAIFNLRNRCATTFHITDDDYYNMMDITQLITREYGYSFVYYNIKEFAAEVTHRCRKNDPLYPLIGFINRSHAKIAAMHHKRYNNDSYREARQQFSNKYPHPTLEQTVSCLMSYMLRERIIVNSPPYRDRIRGDFPTFGVRRSIPK